MQDAKWRAAAAVVFSALFCSMSLGRLLAQDGAQTEDDFYPLARFTIPEGIVLEAGAIEPLPDGTLEVATRRGDIYRVANSADEDPAAATFELYAQGLHEILGLTFRDGWLYATQRGEVTRLTDTDGDNRADETIFTGTAELDRKNAVRNPRNARPAKRIRIDFHRTRRC